MSSNNSTPSRATVPVFSHTSVNVTSKLSPLGTASPASFAKPMLAINSGVGSSEVPLSPGAPELVSDGSDPLSLSSVAVIGMPVESVSGLPSASTAAPPAVTVFSRTPVAAAASTSTVNSKMNESPTANKLGNAVLTSSVEVLPSKFTVSNAIVLPGFDGAVTNERPDTPANAAPNWLARSSSSVKFARSTVPVFSITT